ncbi:type II toxin-antitoxin system HicA family toxin [bacterium]|nr:type II toxin-antitoxin system HicA family toxin [bacterium]
MSKMILSRGKAVVRVLERVGFQIERWEGSHAIMDDGRRIVVVPSGTQRAIVRDAGLTVDKFNELLRKK